MKINAIVTAAALLAAINPATNAAEQTVTVERKVQTGGGSGGGGTTVYSAKPGRIVTSGGGAGGGKSVEVHVVDGEPGHQMAGVDNVFSHVGRMFYGGARSETPLLVTTEEPDAKSIASLEEDMNIMARILEKATGKTGDEGGRKAMGIHLWATDSGPRGARNLYLENYGALFMLSVDFPLVAPGEKEETAKKSESTSSDWEETRHELFGGGKDKEKARAPQPYDAERVAKLKDTLADALKNATHIRALKPEEFVTIVVQGSGGSVSTVRKTRGASRVEEIQIIAGGRGAGVGSVMTLRAKKSDIDAFAKGKIDLEAFKKKLAGAAYRASSGEADREEALF